MVVCLGFWYDVEGSIFALPPIEKHLFYGYASSFNTVTRRWRHDSIIVNELASRQVRQVCLRTTLYCWKSRVEPPYL